MVNIQRPDDKIESQEPEVEGHSQPPYNLNPDNEDAVEGHLHREDLGGLLMGSKPTRPVPKLMDDDEDVAGHVNPPGVD